MYTRIIEIILPFIQSHTTATDIAPHRHWTRPLKEFGTTSGTIFRWCFRWKVDIAEGSRATRGYFIRHFKRTITNTDFFHFSLFLKQRKTIIGWFSVTCISLGNHTIACVAIASAHQTTPHADCHKHSIFLNYIHIYRVYSAHSTNKHLLFN